MECRRDHHEGPSARRGRVAHGRTPSSRPRAATSACASSSPSGPAPITPIEPGRVGRSKIVSLVSTRVAHRVEHLSGTSGLGPRGNHDRLGVSPYDHRRATGSWSRRRNFARASTFTSSGRPVDRIARHPPRTRRARFRTRAITAAPSIFAARCGRRRRSRCLFYRVCRIASRDQQLGGHTTDAGAGGAREGLVDQQRARAVASRVAFGGEPRGARADDRDVAGEIGTDEIGAVEIWLVFGMIDSVSGAFRSWQRNLPTA